MPALTQARVIWAAILPTHLVFGVVAYFVTQTTAAEAALSEFPAVFGAVFVILGIAVSGGSIFMRNLMLRRAARQPERIRFQILLVGMAMAEFPSLLAIVYVVLTGDLTIPMVLVGCGLATQILHFPVRV